jgi:hypothetical protein
MKRKFIRIFNRKENYNSSKILFWMFIPYPITTQKPVLPLLNKRGSAGAYVVSKLLLK